MGKESDEDILKLVTEIVAAYVSKNPVAASDLPAIIKNVHATLGGFAGGPALLTIMDIEGAAPFLFISATIALAALPLLFVGDPDEHRRSAEQREIGEHFKANRERQAGCKAKDSAAPGAPRVGHAGDGDGQRHALECAGQFHSIPR